MPEVSTYFPFDPNIVRAHPMAQAFVSMQIGNVEMDRVYSDAIEPAIVAAELLPLRVDRNNEGGLPKFAHNALTPFTVSCVR